MLKTGITKRNWNR